MSVIKTRLEATIGWAERIREELGPLQQAHGHQVHFRPSATGVAMVGLTPKRPQRGKSGIRDLARLAKDFDEAFHAHCVSTAQGRETPEKALQSFLIRNALSNGRRCCRASWLMEMRPGRLVSTAAVSEARARS